MSIVFFHMFNISGTRRKCIEHSNHRDIRILIGSRIKHRAVFTRLSFEYTYFFKYEMHRRMRSTDIFNPLIFFPGRSPFWTRRRRNIFFFSFDIYLIVTLADGFPTMLHGDGILTR